MKLFRVTLLGLALAAPALCLAQWQWIDKDGRKVYSDQPPSADVPANKILKQPSGKGGRSVAVSEPAPQVAASAPARPAASGPKLSGKDKELEEKKKLADAAAAEKKKAQEEEIAKARTENCERAKRAKATYDSGARVAQVNAKGEREYMDDAARAVETKRLQGVIARDCTPQ
jgi:hypothetical protein